MAKRRSFAFALIFWFFCIKAKEQVKIGSGLQTKPASSGRRRSQKRDGNGYKISIF